MDRSPRSAELSAILVAGFALAMLLPIATTPYLGDDIFNSYISGQIRWGHTPFWAWLGQLNTFWLHKGRFFPGGLLESYGLFYVNPSLGFYKALQVVITLANVATFFVLLRALRIPRTIGLAAVVVLLCTFQMRFYHDGLLGFSVSMEFIAELMLLAMLGLIFFVRRGNVWALAGSLAAYAIALVTYEITYLMGLVFFATLLFELPWRRALRLGAPYLAMSVAAIGIQFYVKGIAHVAPDADYNLSLNIPVLFGTFVKQAIAGIPFSYIAIDPSNLFAHGATVFGKVPFFVTVAVFALVSVSSWILAASIGREPVDPRSIRALVFVGGFFWLTPAVLIASSVRYQRELVFGLGHAPVYLEYFGITMILVAALSYALDRWGVPPWPLRLLAALAFGFWASAVYAANSTVIAMNVEDKQGFLNADAALAAGIMSNVPDDAVLFVDTSFPANRYLDGSPADAKYFYFLKTGKRLTVRFAGTLPKVTQCTGVCRPVQPSYELVNVPVGEFAGYDVLGRVDAIDASHGEVRTYDSDVTLYVRGVPFETPLELRYMVHGCGGRDRLVSRTLTPLPGGAGTVRLVSDCGSIAMHTLVVSAGVAKL